MNDFSQYIQIIGKGKKASKSLTQTQAYQAFKLLLAAEVTPEQAGAFLMLLRVKEESNQELAGFVKACRESTLNELTELRPDLDMGCYAGKRRHLPWFLLAVICLAQAGYTLFLHGTREPNSNRLYLSQVLMELGIPIASSPQQARQFIKKYGFAYMELSSINKPLDNLIQMRSMFGLRSPANSLARMLNPSMAKHSFHGVFHRNFDKKHCDVAALLNDSSVGCIRGEGGEVEVNPERPFDLYIQRKQSSMFSYPALLNYRQIKPSKLNPAELEKLWTGAAQFEYGEQAVIGTIACILTLITNVPTPFSALEQANKLWQQRKPVPFTYYFNNASH